MVSKLLRGIKSMYVNSLACVRVKGVESDRLRIDSEAKQGFIVSLGCSIYIWME